VGEDVDVLVKQTLLGAAAAPSRFMPIGA